MIIMIISVILLVALDQFTKYLTVLHIPRNGYIPLIGDVFGLSHVRNEGAAFGSLQGSRWFFIIITTIIIIAMLYAYAKIPKHKRYMPIRITLTLIIAGAIGNYIDRIRLTYVVDMLYVKLINFPVFNAADCYVVVGATLLVVLMLFKYKEEDFSFLKRSKE